MRPLFQMFLLAWFLAEAGSFPTGGGMNLLASGDGDQRRWLGGAIALGAFAEGCKGDGSGELSHGGLCWKNSRETARESHPTGGLVFGAGRERARFGVQLLAMLAVLAALGKRPRFWRVAGQWASVVGAHGLAALEEATEPCRSVAWTTALPAATSTTVSSYLRFSHSDPFRTLPDLTRNARVPLGRPLEYTSCRLCAKRRSYATLPLG
jgi:hypothetical protein